MSKANTQNFFVHGIQFLQEIQELTDPNVISMRIIAASGDDKPIKEFDLIVLRELSRRNAIHIPCFTFLRQHSHKHPKIASIHLLHVIRVLRAEKNSKSFPTHFPTLSLTPQNVCLSLSLLLFLSPSPN